MRTLLRVDASSQSQQSYSRQLADHMVELWKVGYPQGKILVRDVVKEPLPHLEQKTIEVFYQGGNPRPGEEVPMGIKLSDQLIAELKQADDIVVSSALYNFGMPSALKAWLDHLVRFGHTITTHENGGRPVGLMTGKRAFFITARGGTPETSPDYQYPVLQAVFAYVGITNTHWISLEGTRFSDGQIDARVEHAKATIKSLILTKRG